VDAIVRLNCKGIFTQNNVWYVNLFVSTLKHSFYSGRCEECIELLKLLCSWSYIRPCCNYRHNEWCKRKRLITAWDIIRIVMDHNYYYCSNCFYPGFV
jgi:hypothetical protein